MEPHSGVVTQRTPQALRGDALRGALVPLGFDGDFVADAVARAELRERAPSFPEVDPGPPPSSDAPRALVGDELMRVLEALRTPE